MSLEIHSKKISRIQKSKKKKLLHWRPSPIVFPVHSQIRAGQEGNFIFESEAELDASFEELVINNIPHSFYNTRDEGAPIIFRAKAHRWFQIDGDSMNEASPIPIENKDYVLAIDSWEPQIGDIVVAELYSPSASERAGVVKKLTKNGLQSMSSSTYPNIPLDRVAAPRGVVIAVAKPIPQDEQR